MGVGRGLQWLSDSQPHPCLLTRLPSSVKSHKITEPICSQCQKTARDQEAVDLHI